MRRFAPGNWLRDDSTGEYEPVPARIVARMSDKNEPADTTQENSAGIDRDNAKNPTPPDQADARAELANVLDDLEGYGER